MFELGHATRLPGSGQTIRVITQTFNNHNTAQICNVRNRDDNGVPQQHLAFFHQHGISLGAGECALVGAMIVVRGGG